MANDNYSTGVAPNSILLASEAEQGMSNNGGAGPPVRRRGRNRSLGGSKRDKLTMAEMKSQMSALWKEQYTYVEIADKINEQFALEGDDQVKPNNIQYHIKSLLDTARKQSALHINERQALILARYDQIEMLATEAYFASMQSDTTNYERMVKQARSKDREKQILETYQREKKRVERINKKRAAAHRKLLPVPTMDSVRGDLPDLLVTTAENIKEYIRTESKPAGDPRWIALIMDIQEKRAKLFGLLNRTDISNPDQDLAKLPDEERESRMAALLHRVQTRATGDVGNLADPSPLGGLDRKSVV